MKNIYRLKVLRNIIYSLEIFAAFILQVTPYMLPEVFGERAVVLVPLALSFSFYEKDIPSIAFASVCGLLTDCSYSGAVGFYAVALVISCYFVSNLFENCIFRTLLTVMMISSVVIPVIFFVQFLLYYAAAGYDGIWFFLIRHYIPRMIYTLAFVPLLYKLNGFVYKKISNKRGGVRALWK